MAEPGRPRRRRYAGMPTETAREIRELKRKNTGLERTIEILKAERLMAAHGWRGAIRPGRSVPPIADPAAAPGYRTCSGGTSPPPGPISCG